MKRATVPESCFKKGRLASSVCCILPIDGKDSQKVKIHLTFRGQQVVFVCVELLFDFASEHFYDY